MSGTTPEAATSGTTPASETADLVSLGDEQRAIEILAQSIPGRCGVVNNLPRLRPQRRHEEWISERVARVMTTDPSAAQLALDRQAAARLGRVIRTSPPPSWAAEPPR